MLCSLKQITWTLKAIRSTFNLGFGEDHGVSYMPLSHTAGQVGASVLCVMCVFGGPMCVWWCVCGGPVCGGACPV